MVTPDRNLELQEARSLAMATMTAPDRFGLRLSYDELKGMDTNLEQANRLLKRFQADERPSDLMAAMAAID